MKLIFFVTIFLSTWVCSFSNNNPYHIIKIEISDPRLSIAIIDYLQEFEEEFTENAAALVVKFDNSNPNKFYFAFKVHKVEVLNDPPSYYSIIRGQLVLIYTGFESYLRYDTRSFRSLLKDAKRQLTQIGVTYNPIVWAVTLHENSYSKEIIELLPR